MVFCALIPRPHVNQTANIALDIVYALTSVACARSYYILGSLADVVLLAAIAYFAWA